MAKGKRLIGLVKKDGTNIFRAYSAVLFLDSVYAGLFIAAVTFLAPNIGIAGAISVFSASLILRFFSFPHAKSGLHLLNSLLVGLSIGAFYQLNGTVFFLIIMGAGLTVLLTAALMDVFENQRHLPVLSLPFLIVASVMTLLAKKIGNIKPFLDGDFYGFIWPTTFYGATSWVTFFESLGATFFTTQPLAGMIIFIAIFVRSRYLTLLTVSGYCFGSFFLIALAGPDSPPQLIQWTGFNFVLVAIALGGIYTIPSIAGFTTALLGVAVSSLFILAIQDLLFVYGLPILALPFVGTTMIFLLALRSRVGGNKPWLSAQPGLPEINYENTRLAKVRNGEFNSVPLLAPFYGQWSIYQGFKGPYTHKDAWQHALDFYITADDKSFDNEGKNSEDYYCFGLPVLSPAYGLVIRIQNGLSDNKPGEVDNANNWGNFILIRLDNGFYVLLAHLKNNSMLVSEGDRVKPGDKLAACGNSGRSPQPHLHLHVQKNAELGSGTCAFHLQSIIHHLPNKNDGEYQLFSVPETGQCIEPASIDENLARPLHLPVGRQMRYELFVNDQKQGMSATLKVELSLLGQFRLVGSQGASAAFVEANGVLAFFDRQGPKDPLLDLWLLANGLTPLARIAQRWTDSPSAYLLALPPWQRLWLISLSPLGCGLNSHYCRNWDHQKNQWKQYSNHQLFIGSSNSSAEVSSTIDPVLGCVELRMQYKKKNWRAILKETGLSSDEGIPGWNISNPSRDN